MSTAADELALLLTDGGGLAYQQVEDGGEQGYEESIDYVSEPTGDLFHLSAAKIRGVMGPIGSGKSVMCSVELVRQSMDAPIHKNVRRSRYAIIRNTYGELKSTTIKTFGEWIPSAYTRWVFDAPIYCYFEMERPDDKTVIKAEFIFLSLDKPKDVKKLKSLELTGFWINEASEIPKAVLDMADGRIGRYPAKRQGGGRAKFFGILDTNPPDDDHWWHDLAEEEKPEGYEFFHQPPAVLEQGNGDWVINPQCENVVNQPKGERYWLDQIPGKTRNWIGVFLQGKYGSVEDGKVVYPEWMPQLHLADMPLAATKGLALILGWDFGLTPAVVICQVTLRGQFLVLDELVSVRMGIKQFARDIVKPFITNKYHGYRLVNFADPAGVAGAQTDERTCFRELAEQGFPATPTITNAFVPRREAVAEHMTRLIDGQPGFLVSTTCKYLRRGFNGRYKFRRMQVPGEELYSETAIKNEVSHPHDALQYAALGCKTVDVNTMHIQKQVVGRSNNWKAM